MFKTFYPQGYNPIHPVNDWAYVRKMIRDSRKGISIPAFVVDGESLVTGTHRCAANNLMTMLWERREMSPKPALIEAIQLEDLDIDDETREAVIEALTWEQYDTVQDLLGVN